MFDIREKISKNLENIFLIIFVGIFLWMSIGPIFQYKLIHSRPTGFGASDSYAWFAYAQSIYELGSFKYTPPFMNLNIEGLTSPEPPLFLQFTAFLAYALRIPVYDSQILFGSLLIILTILMFFILIKEYNPFLAYLSLPLCTFSFTFPFVSGLIFGVLPAIFGFLFLFACLFMLFHMDLKYASIAMGIFISSMVMGHTVRVFEFAFFGGAFIILSLLFNKIDRNFIKKLLISGLLAFTISLYYLTIFKQRLFEAKGDVFSFIPADAARYLRITLNDFELIKYVILAGLILCAYFLIKERKNTRGMIFVFPIVAFLLIQFLRMGKIYQVTFFWPVLLGLAFGLAIFSSLQLKWFSKINSHKLTYFIISLTVTILFIYQYYSLFREPILEKISETGMTTPISTQDQWDDLIWLSENTEPDSKILFFYFNDQSADGIFPFFPSKRLSFYVHLNEIDSAIERNITKKDYNILDNSVAFFYKRIPEFPLKVVSLDKSEYLKNMSICDFDYIYAKRAIRVVHQDDKKFLNKPVEKRVLYVIELINMLLKNKYIKIVHQDNEAYIIKNNNPRGECI